MYNTKSTVPGFRVLVGSRVSWHARYKAGMCLATGFALPYALCDAAHLATQKLLLFIFQPTFLCGHSGLLFLRNFYCVKASMLLREFLNIMASLNFFQAVVSLWSNFLFLCWSIPVDLC